MSRRQEASNAPSAMHAALAEWWNGISLTTKVTAVTVVLVSLALVVSGFGTIAVLRDYAVSDLDSQVQQEISVITRDTVHDDERSAITQFVIARYDSAGGLVFSNDSWKAAQPQAPTFTAEFVRAHRTTAFTVRTASGTGSYRMMVKSVGDDTVALGLSLDTVDAFIARLFTIFFLFGIVVVLACAALTRLLVSSTFAPLREVERTAAAIADGDFGQRLGNTTPNTEVGRLNRSLNRMLNRIDRALADRARTIDQMRRFVGDASHELRTPLVTVRGYAELYRMGALQTEDDVAQAMDRIEREAIRLGALVSDLLALARLDEAKPLDRTPVELLPLAHDAALDARALAPKRTIRVIGHEPGLNTAALEVLPPMVGSAAPKPEQDAAAQSGETSPGRRFRRSVTTIAATNRLRLRRRATESDGATPAIVAPPTTSELRPEPHTTLPLVYAEEDKIRQVLTNLIGNAIRFTPDDSPIEIAAYVDEHRDAAVLEVIDHGEGIPPQIRERIFQRFWRADSSRARDTGGSGLGLAIVAAIVHAHQGTVGISETQGGGATFRVSFPLLHSGEQPTDSVQADHEAPAITSRS